MVLEVDRELIGLGISRWCEKYKCDQCGQKSSARNKILVFNAKMLAVSKKTTKTHDEQKHFATNKYICDLCNYVIRMVEKALYFLNHSLSSLTSTSVASESINAELH